MMFKVPSVAFSPSIKPVTVLTAFTVKEPPSRSMLVTVKAPVPARVKVNPLSTSTFDAVVVSATKAFAPEPMVALPSTLTVSSVAFAVSCTAPVREEPAAKLIVTDAAPFALERSTVPATTEFTAIFNTETVPARSLMSMVPE